MPFLREKSARYFGWLRNRKRFIALAVLLCVVMAAPLAALAGGDPPQATGPSRVGNFVLLLVAEYLQIFVAFWGTMLLMAVYLLIWVAQYNGFVDAPAVTNGWSIIRDVVNMFFILVMLLMAFGTILGIEKYSYKKNLSGLLIMAIVVNFTRTICGILIDFGQVVMLTFVYGFKDAAGGNFANAFQITKILEPNDASKGIDLVEDSAKSGFAFDTVLTLILGVILCAIAFFLVLYMTLMLLIRIIYLWLLVVVSPLAFFLRAVPTSAANKYYGEWWSMFTGQIVFGPVMAFFLWLSLVSVAGGKFRENSGFTQPAGDAESFKFGGSTGKAASADVLMNYIIAICLMAGGTALATKIAGSTGGMAKGVAGKMTGGAVKAGKAVGGAAANTAIPGTKSAKNPSGLSLASLGKAAKTSLAKKGPLSRVFESKEQKDERALRQEAAAQRQIGNIGEADKIDRKIVAKKLSDMKDMKKADLEKEFRDPNGDRYSKRAAAEALAGTGYFKGSGKDLPVKLREAGIADHDLEQRIREKNKSLGDKDAFITSDLDSATAWNNLDTKARGERMTDPLGDVAPDRNGRAKRPGVLVELAETDAEDYASYKPKKKEAVLDAALLGARTAQDPAMRQALADKFTELSGVPFDMARAQALVNQHQAGRLGERLERPVPADTSERENQRVLAGNAKSSGLLADLESTQRSAKDGSFNLNDTKVEAADLLAKYAAMGGDGTSQIAKDLEAAAVAPNIDEAAERLKAAANGLDYAIKQGKLTPDAQVRVAQGIQQGKSTFGKAEGEFDEVFAARTPQEKFQAARKATSMTMSAVDSLSRDASAGLSKEMMAGIEKLKTELLAIRAEKSFTPEMFARIGTIKNQLAALQKKM